MKNLDPKKHPLINDSFEIFALFLQNGSLARSLQEINKNSTNNFFIVLVYMTKPPIRREANYSISQGGLFIAF
jgi:hypothetical protein